MLEHRSLGMKFSPRFRVARRTVAVPLALTALASLAVLAQDRHMSGPYLRLGAGLVTSEDVDAPDESIEIDQGYEVNAALGTRVFSPRERVNLDLELEGLWSEQDARDDAPRVALGNAGISAGFFNALVDVRLDRRLSAYAGAGIGAAWLDLDPQEDAISEYIDEDGPFTAWQAKAGLSLRVSRSTLFSVGYRFVAVEGAQVEESLSGERFDFDSRQHALEFGFRFGL